MSFASKSRVSTVLLLVLIAGCSPAVPGPTIGAPKRWVLVSNPRYDAQGSEREYTWVDEDDIPTTLTTALFGKKMVIAPPYEVPRYAPPPGNGVISPLQGGIYAQETAEPGAVAPAAPTARPAEPVASAVSRASGAPAPAAPGPPTPGVTPRGYVVYVDSPRVIIDLNVQHGLKVGDLVQIRREKTPLVHPVSGAYLGELDEEIATAQVIEVREKFAVVVIKELAAGAQVRVKDRVVPQL
jgi:Flagellar assembly protein T, C-terminal domain